MPRKIEPSREGVDSPAQLRRSTRISQVVDEGSQPAPIATRRRSSATEPPSTPAKATRAKRLSQSEENGATVTSTPIARITRSASRSPSIVSKENLPLKRTTRKGSTSSLIEEETEGRIGSPIPTSVTLRRRVTRSMSREGSPPQEPVELEPAKRKRRGSTTDRTALDVIEEIEATGDGGRPPPKENGDNKLDVIEEVDNDDVFKETSSNNLQDKTDAVDSKAEGEKRKSTDAANPAEGEKRKSTDLKSDSKYARLSLSKNKSSSMESLHLDVSAKLNESGSSTTSNKENENVNKTCTVVLNKSDVEMERGKRRSSSHKGAHSLDEPMEIDMSVAINETALPDSDNEKNSSRDAAKMSDSPRRSTRLSKSLNDSSSATSTASPKKKLENLIDANLEDDVRSQAKETKAESKSDTPTKRIDDMITSGLIDPDSDEETQLNQVMDMVEKANKSITPAKKSNVTQTDDTTGDLIDLDATQLVAKPVETCEPSKASVISEDVIPDSQDVSQRACARTQAPEMATNESEIDSTVVEECAEVTVETTVPQDDNDDAIVTRQKQKSADSSLNTSVKLSKSNVTIEDVPDEESDRETEKLRRSARKSTSKAEKMVAADSDDEIATPQKQKSADSSLNISVKQSKSNVTIEDVPDDESERQTETLRRSARKSTGKAEKMVAEDSDDEIATPQKQKSADSSLNTSVKRSKSNVTIEDVPDEESDRETEKLRRYARKSTGRAEKILAESKSTLNDSKSSLNDSKSSLNDSKSSSNDRRSTLNDSKSSMNASKSSVNARKSLNDSKSSLNDSRSSKTEQSPKNKPSESPAVAKSPATKQRKSLEKAANVKSTSSLPPKEMQPSKNDINRKLDELIEKNASLDTSDAEEMLRDFFDEMADEGDEDTPSDGSNDIIEVGESIGSTDSQVDSDESYERDSFVADDDDIASVELLPGDEFDLGQAKKPKRIYQRIVTEDSDEANNSDLDDMSTRPNLGLSPESTQLEIEEITSEVTEISDGSLEPHIEEPEDEVLEMVEEEDCEEVLEVSRDGDVDVTAVTRRKSSSLTVYENLSLDEMGEGHVTEKIGKVLEYFCSTIKKSKRESSGSVSLNISVDYIAADEEKSPVKRRSQETLPDEPPAKKAALDDEEDVANEGDGSQKDTSMSSTGSKTKKKAKNKKILDDTFETVKNKQKKTEQKEDKLELIDQLSDDLDDSLEKKYSKGAQKKHTATPGRVTRGSQKKHQTPIDYCPQEVLAKVENSNFRASPFDSRKTMKPSKCGGDENVSVVAKKKVRASKVGPMAEWNQEEVNMLMLKPSKSSKLSSKTVLRSGKKVKLGAFQMDEKDFKNQMLYSGRVERMATQQLIGRNKRR